MMHINVIAITGKTYPARRALKRAVGGPRFTHFEKEPEPTWYVPIEKLEAISEVVEQYGLDAEQTTLTVEENPFRELEREEIRQRRAENNTRKAERLESRAASKRGKASNLCPSGKGRLITSEMVHLDGHAFRFQASGISKTLVYR
ncbi:hypothetical protein SCOR_27460 [Sulfidibacter corallicola]|uniref:Uncharacterized protein n=1 Tax=Sulfidibacter corallicola TaxID=2818388 RepID=A0A8A4TW02_SULCO|nr:hypothetical protein [Sulfidibacter corallicola]QTD50705.1 hypothetical protein J3U87_34395 [Sulfidibacter corallicola]